MPFDYGNLLENKKLFSQINSNFEINTLSEVNPMESLSNVTGPLNNIWKTLEGPLRILGGDTASSGPLKPNLEGRLSSWDTSTTGQILEKGKSALILIGKILVVVLEISLSILKWLLSFTG